jgi:hypothetical protein
MKASFHVFVTDKMELILNPETGKIESAIFLEPFQAKSMKVYDGVVLRGKKKKELDDKDAWQIIYLARTFWELGGIRVEFVKMNLSNKGSSLTRTRVTEKNDVEAIMWGLN